MPAAKSPLRGACFPRRHSFLSARARVRCGWYQDLGQDGAVQLIHGHLGDPMGRSGNLLGPEFDRSSIQEVFSDHDAEMLIVQPDSTGRARSWRRAGARPAACARAFPRASPLSQHRPAGGRRAGDRAARGTRCCARGGGIEPARAREAAKRRCRRRWRCGRSASGARACVLAGEPPCTAPELSRVSPAPLTPPRSVQSNDEANRRGDVAIYEEDTVGDVRSVALPRLAPHLA